MRGIVADGSLAGRERELARIDAVVERAAAGSSGALLVSGESGIGKSALLQAVGERAAARGATVLRARGWESEAEIPYAALLELLRPVLGMLDAIPSVQATALGAAMALSEPSEHDSFAIPAGVLSLLAAVAARSPLVALVDDVQWVDAASRDALLFAARRLGADGVVIVFAQRDGSGEHVDSSGLERIPLGGLAGDVAVALALATDERLVRPVAEALAEQTGGNPLALLETPMLLSDAQRAGREPLDAPLPPVARIGRALELRLAQLPGDARQAMVLAAAAQTDDLPAFGRALAVSGLPGDALEPAERAGLVAVSGERFSIRHPLLRSTAYHGASAAERRAAHRALADAARDPRLRAWHLALAAFEPDERVAADLDAAARDARMRGGHAEAARAWDRAAALSPGAAEAARRWVDAGAAWIDAGHPGKALESIERIDPGEAGEALAGAARRIAAQVELRRDPLTARRLLLAEADRLAETDRATAAALTLEASVAHMMSGDMVALIADVRRARELAAGVQPAYATVADIIVAEAEIALGNIDAGEPVLAAHMETVLAADPLALGIEVIGLAGCCLCWIEEWERAEAILDRCIVAAREASAFGKLVYPLAARAQLDFRRGRWRQALAGADEAVTLARVTGQDAILAFALSVLAEVEAGRGDAAAAAHADEAAGLCERFGSRAVLAYALRALALDHLAQQRVEAAIEVCARASAIAEQIQMGAAGVVMWMPDEVEALARAGSTAAAEAALERFRPRAVSGGAWGPAAVERCAGLLAPAAAVDDHFARAMELHADDGQPFEAARTALLWGERLRRDRRRARAREPLTRALETFGALGAAPWRGRAERELLAAGGELPRSGATRPAAAPVLTVAAAGAEAIDELTPAELQVALMVAAGHRNREVAAALFLSQKTVERHLTAIYRKLGVRSRTELANAVSGEPPRF
ncbi:AAA family ATPase [Conexibacter stalactiti]|uniref:AAA family ATPase n=1 Tax=Conexibacter stalactiti TaxID=1940611 RepID=A0ABU4HV37_9ACTN|nr:AAA family ATPase [Conexibacter stalactiti]MDW5597054.1 AAA family ATPase [Conexibacter stalactiti]MEC5037696.1 AAA family ATPase [Conexibacter stalactiti]